MAGTRAGTAQIVTTITVGKGAGTAWIVTTITVGKIMDTGTITTTARMITCGMATTIRHARYYQTRILDSLTNLLVEYSSSPC
jgi:hypothetical protein